MYSRRQQNLIGRTSALEGVPRRRLPDYVTGKVVVEYQLPCRDDMRCSPKA